MTADQIEFVSLIIDHLTEHGVMEPELLYASPFTDVNPRGPNGLFDARQVSALIDVLARVKSAAEAA